MLCTQQHRAVVVVSAGHFYRCSPLPPNPCTSIYIPLADKSIRSSLDPFALGASIKWNTPPTGGGGEMCFAQTEKFANYTTDKSNKKTKKTKKHKKTKHKT